MIDLRETAANKLPPVKVPQNGRSFVLYALAAAPRLFPFKEGTVEKIAVYCE
jgi:hypothetical protein